MKELLENDIKFIVFGHHTVGHMRLTFRWLIGDGCEMHKTCSLLGLQYIHQVRRPTPSTMTSILHARHIRRPAEMQDMLCAMEKVCTQEDVGYIRIDGSTPAERRGDQVKKFQLETGCKVCTGAA